MLKTIEKTVKKAIARHYRKKGYNPFAANSVATNIAEELFKNECNMSLKERMWAWKRGFTATQSKMFELNDDNYKDYLSNADYMSLYPLNNQSRRWIDDKLTFRYVLSKYSNYLPEYYFSISETGKINKLMDWPEDIYLQDFESILTFLKQKGIIAAKKYRGCAGEGFYKLEYIEEKLYANKKELSEQQFIKLIRMLKGYVFTEFIRQHNLFEELCPEIAHTTRIQTARTKDGNIECLLSFIRIGKSTMNACITHSTSGITASVNVNNGMITGAFYVDGNSNFVNIKNHPDNNKPLDFEIPRWNEIVSKCIEIHNYIGELDYLGFDVIVTKDSFKICEINSFSSIRSAQKSFPVWKDKKCSEFFEWKLKEK